MSSPVTATSREVVPASKTSVTPTTTKPSTPPPTPSGSPSEGSPFTGKTDTPPAPRSSSSPSLPSFSTSGPTDTIIVCSMVMIGSSLIKDVAHGQPSIKPVVTGMMLGGALLIIGTFAPTLAKLLAITGLVGALMTNGSTLINIGEKIK